MPKWLPTAAWRRAAGDGMVGVTAPSMRRAEASLVLLLASAASAALLKGGEIGQSTWVIAGIPCLRVACFFCYEMQIPSFHRLFFESVQGLCTFAGVFA